jgi:hypothetical protein
MTLIPYEVAAKVTLNRQDLDDLLTGPPASQWVSEQASGWLQLWRWGLQTDGFFPFDTLAVGYVTGSQRFQCDLLSAQVVSRRGIWSSTLTLEVSKHIQNGNLVTYCYNVSPQFKLDLMQRLRAGGDCNVCSQGGCSACKRRDGDGHTSTTRKGENMT